MDEMQVRRQKVASADSVLAELLGGSATAYDELSVRCGAPLPGRSPSSLRRAGESRVGRPEVVEATKETTVYAIVRAGSKQQKVAVGDVIEIDKTDAAVGATLTLPVVLTVDGETVTATGLDKAGVTVEVLGATKGPKIIIQKYKNKTGYKKRQGHRQKYTQVKVTDISL
jgi:large subunit ribosomal protein L21